MFKSNSFKQMPQYVYILSLQFCLTRFSMCVIIRKDKWRYVKYWRNSPLFGKRFPIWRYVTEIRYITRLTNCEINVTCGNTRKNVSSRKSIYKRQKDVKTVDRKMRFRPIRTQIRMRQISRQLGTTDTYFRN